MYISTQVYGECMWLESAVDYRTKLTTTSSRLISFCMLILYYFCNYESFAFCNYTQQSSVGVLLPENAGNLRRQIKWNYKHLKQLVCIPARSYPPPLSLLPPPLPFLCPLDPLPSLPPLSRCVCQVWTHCQHLWPVCVQCVYIYTYLYICVHVSLCVCVCILHPTFFVEAWAPLRYDQQWESCQESWKASFVAEILCWKINYLCIVYTHPPTLTPGLI